MKLVSRFHSRVGIDLGTDRVRIWTDQDGFVVDEATTIAIDQSTKKVVAVGDEARSMKLRVAAPIQVFDPVEQSRIADADLVFTLVQILLQRVVTGVSFFRPLMMVSVSASCTPAVRQVLTDVLYSLGAREVFTISQSLASAIGSGVPVADASGTFLLQLGEGSVEGSVISLGSVVSQEFIWEGSWYLEQRLGLQLKQAYTLQVSHEVLRQIKHSLVTVSSTSESRLLSGRDIRTNSPKEVEVASSVLQPTALKVATKYVQVMKRLLKNVPPELTGDLVDKGILLAGGGAQLGGVDEFLATQVGVPVTVVDEPDKTVIKGIALALEHLEEFQHSLGYR